MQMYILTGTGGNDSSGEPNKGSGFSWPGWEARVAADPQFVYKVMVEQVRPALHNSKLRLPNTKQYSPAECLEV